MSMLSEFLAKPNILEIEGKKLEIYPLKVKNLDLFNKDNLTKEEQLAISIKIIKLSLEQTMPNITEEEISNLSIDVFTKILDTVFEVNGFKEDERTKSIKEKIAEAGTK